MQCLFYLPLANRILYLDKGVVLVERVVGIEEKVVVYVIKFMMRGRIHVE
jgi:hypothetical protein